ncbi:uncharacterized protein I303_101172 [Kwoniella dejecticola CBS 10117]|uniref:Uncharacterized protein n=1 Tax=Kwoniella dejecticola CBS 10117 TaxID=1296121 RepID=A0A1A6AH08_9TREE|nr:uncharacterized protein I303_01179 [Kwoniella dejecticola CBS 10117]OBR89352.1 hypothetical protein I303_01179 [Kwoniella dejecticola CBS 10117]
MDLGTGGLPLSFGKQPSALPNKPPQAAHQTNGGSRGVGRGRGRGGSGSGRGRGRGGAVHSDSGYGQRLGAQNDNINAEQHEFVGGMKRSHPNSPNDSSASSSRNVPPHLRQNNHSDRGGRGGGPRNIHGNRNGNVFGHGGSEKGFWKDSFLEDPWKELEEKRGKIRRQRTDTRQNQES